MAQYIPDKGDVIWLSFDPQAGHEQSGRRPAFVVSPKSYNQKVGLFLVCPITSRKKGYPFEVEITTDRGVHGVVLSDQLKSLDWKARRAEFIEKALPDLTEEVIARILPIIESED
jgi:mRNA interferase MazF